MHITIIFDVKFKFQLEISSREKINNEVVISLEEVRKDRDSVKKSLDTLQGESTSHKEKLATANSRIESLTAGNKRCHSVRQKQSKNCPGAFKIPDCRAHAFILNE